MNFQPEIIQSNQQQDKYRILWSKEKFQEMESALAGYWSTDVWEGIKNHFKNQDRTSLTLKFFHSSYVVRTELKFVLYKKMIAREWSWGTVHVNNVLKEVIEFFEEEDLIESSSIIDTSLDGLIERCR